MRERGQEGQSSRVGRDSLDRECMCLHCTSHLLLVLSDELIVTDEVYQVSVIRFTRQLSLGYSAVCLQDPSCFCRGQPMT